MIQIDDSVNAFSAYVTHASFTFAGPIGATPILSMGLAKARTRLLPQPGNFALYWKDLADIRWGTMSAVIRVNVKTLTAAHMTYQAWLEY